MAHQTRIGIRLALALLPALGPAAAVAAESGFCVEDKDDALWIDCERNDDGTTGRAFVLCRRAPTKELMERRAPLPVMEEITDIARELSPGSGDCPAAGAMRAAASGPGKGGIPRTDGEEAGVGGEVTDGAGSGAAAPVAGGTPAPPGAGPRPVPETAHGR